MQLVNWKCWFIYCRTDGGGREHHLCTCQLTMQSKDWHPVNIRGRQREELSLDCLRKYSTFLNIQTLKSYQWGVCLCWMEARVKRWCFHHRARFFLWGTMLMFPEKFITSPGAISHRPTWGNKCPIAQPAAACPLFASVFQHACLLADYGVKGYYSPTVRGTEQQGRISPHTGQTWENMCTTCVFFCVQNEVIIMKCKICLSLHWLTSSGKFIFVVLVDKWNH